MFRGRSPLVSILFVLFTLPAYAEFTFQSGDQFSVDIDWFYAQVDCQTPRSIYYMGAVQCEYYEVRPQENDRLVGTVNEQITRVQLKWDKYKRVFDYDGNAGESEEIFLLDVERLPNERGYYWARDEFDCRVRR